MPIRRLQVSNFRCLQSAEIEFDPSLTLLSGPNGSGKTSVLESLYVLGRGRSFRTRRLDRLIRSGESRFTLFGEVDTGSRRSPLGVEGSSEGMRARIAGEKASSLGELAAAFPVQIIDPEVHRLIEEGPSCRRQFLDWGVFHVEHAFLGHWKQFQQILKQRNAALKARQPRSLVSAWNPEFVRLGDVISAARMRYVENFRPVAMEVVARLLATPVTLRYRPGWPADTTLQGALEASSMLEHDLGTTQVGPQRAELVINLDGVAVKDRISRGQQKLLAVSLLIAQLRMFSDAAARPTLLLDDPAAELDNNGLARLIDEVGRLTSQLVATSLDPEFLSLGRPGRRYLVSHGAIVEQ